MKKRLLIGLGALLGSLLLLLAGARLASADRQAATYDIAAMAVPLPADPESLAEGERLFVSRGCGGGDCHAADGGGHVIMDDGAFGTIVASNLTVVAPDLSAEDWDRAVRHGVGRDGHSLVFMPSGDFAAMSDRELGLIAAYARTLPPVERELPQTSPGMLARVLDLAGAVDLFPASHIDHAAVAEPDVEPGRTAEYGGYLARMCMGCHGTQLSGGPIPGAPPELGNPRNLTFHETGLGAWSEQDFVHAMRDGVTPDGGTLDPRQMPWPDLSRMNDDELGAIYLYLQTLPHVEEGNR